VCLVVYVFIVGLLVGLVSGLVSLVRLARTAMAWPASGAPRTLVGVASILAGRVRHNVVLFWRDARRALGRLRSVDV